MCRRSELVGRIDPTIKTSLQCSHAWPTTHGSRSPRHQQPSLCFYATLPLTDLIFFPTSPYCCRCFLWVWWISFEWLSHRIGGMLSVCGKTNVHCCACGCPVRPRNILFQQWHFSVPVSNSHPVGFTMWSHKTFNVTTLCYFPWVGTLQVHLWWKNVVY